MPRSDVSYYSDGLKIAAYLYTPDDWQEGDPPRPGILCLSGFSGMKNVYLLPVMERLVKEGWFCLAPDNRGFGESEGARGRHRPLEQAQDCYDALTFMQTIPGIDPNRLGIYGTSFGGANAIWVAAHDERVKCVVTSVAVTHGERWLRLIRRPWEWWAFRDRVEEAAKRRVRTGEKTIAPVPEILLRDPHSAWVRENFSAKAENFIAEYDLESAEASFRYRPEWVVDKISPRPVMFIYAERDGLVPPEDQLSCFEKCGEPKKLVTLPGARHYDSYEFVNPKMSAIGMNEAIGWFRKFL